MAAVDRCFFCVFGLFEHLLRVFVHVTGLGFCFRLRFCDGHDIVRIDRVCTLGIGLDFSFHSLGAGVFGSNLHHWAMMQ